MLERINALLAEIEAFETNIEAEAESFRIKILGKKGILTALFDEFKELPAEQKAPIGKPLNVLKNKAQEKIATLKEKLNAGVKDDYSGIDLTMPSGASIPGSRHPLNIVRSIILEIFSRQGFSVAEGPEIEDDWHNFSALNFPPEHPARDMQDTFFVEKNPDISLRTHTSSVQVRVMQSQSPPIKILAPGRVFRNEAISARSHCFFHQVEGLYVDKDVSFADLKQTLLYFSREMFGEKTEIRLRPSFFPFTEPSAEMDISCLICGGGGCNICKYSGWVEILGCGMVDPQVLENCGIDSKIYTGYAFGMGIERITMLLYQIKDIRLFFENDVRFLQQFSSSH